MQLVRRTQRHDHSPVIAVFQGNEGKEKARYEPAWSAEATNASWMNGWKRPEVTGALCEAFQENKAEFDRLVDSEKTIYSINDFFMEAVKEAVQPFLAKRPKDEEEWVIRSQAEVTTLLKQRKDEREGAHKKGGVTANVGGSQRNCRLGKRPTEKIWRLSVTLVLGQKVAWRILAGQAMGTRRRHLSRLPANRQSLEERAQTPSNPLTEADAGACESSSSMRSKR